MLISQTIDGRTEPWILRAVAPKQTPRIDPESKYVKVISMAMVILERNSMNIDLTEQT